MKDFGKSDLMVGDVIHCRYWWKGVVKDYDGQLVIVDKEDSYIKVNHYDDDFNINGFGDDFNIMKVYRYGELIWERK